jgi:mono/diheme cytochrome c family protein
MNRFRLLGSRLRIGTSLALVGAAIYAASIAGVQGADTKAEAKTEKKKLTGNELYQMHCNRCHPERYATERTAAQWKTIMLHMRVRANLPAAQAKAILAYLQEDSGN